MAFAASGFLQAALLVLLAAALAFAWSRVAALRRLRAELASERRRITLVLRATRSGIIDWDVPGKRVDYSGRFKEMLGYQPHVDLTDRAAPEFFAWVHEDDRERTRLAFIEHLRARRDGDGEMLHPPVEYRMRRVDGEYVWVRGTGLSLRGADGRAIRYISAVIDISEAKRHEAEVSGQVQLINDLLDSMKTQEQRLSLVVRAAQSGIIDWPGGTREVYYSDRFKAILGYPPDADTSGWPEFFEMIHPQDRARVHGTLLEHLRLRSDAAETLHDAIEYRLRRADGSWVWVQGMGVSLRDADGRATRFLASITDITERRRRDETLRDQIKLTRDIIDANPNPIFLKDAHGRHLEVNAAWEKLTGVAAANVIGRTTAETFPPDIAATYIDQDRALLESGEATRSDVAQVMRKDGVHTYLLAKSVLRRSDGTVYGLVGTVTDVTPLKRIEQELRASREEALQAAQAKSAFLATMSHEIRTPLNGVLGMAGLLAGTELTEEQRECVDTIRLSGDALLAAINDILDYSKIESGRMQLENEPLEPVRAIEDSLGILGERARAKGLELIAEVDDAVPAWVRGDFGRLRQVLVNLVGNAVKFTERGEVVVGVR